jgi:hypothetical protein
LEQAQEIELALGVHVGDDVVGRKIVDADDDVAAQIAELLWQTFEGGARQRFEIGEAWSFEMAQLPQRNPVDWQNDTPCSALALTVATAAIAPAAIVTAIMLTMMRRRNRASA